jgi:hypothetical protein
MKRVEIRFRGHIDKAWSDRLGGLDILHLPDGNTALSGFVCDQSALYGILSCLSDLGLELISITTIDELPKTYDKGEKI